MNGGEPGIILLVDLPYLHSFPSLLGDDPRKIPVTGIRTHVPTCQKKVTWLPTELPGEKKEKKKEENNKKNS